MQRRFAKTKIRTDALQRSKTPSDPLDGVQFLDKCAQDLTLPAACRRRGDKESWELVFKVTWVCGPNLR